MILECSCALTHWRGVGLHPAHSISITMQPRYILVRHWWASHTSSPHQAQTPPRAAMHSPHVVNCWHCSLNSNGSGTNQHKGKKTFREWELEKLATDHGTEHLAHFTFSGKWGNLAVKHSKAPSHLQWSRTWVAQRASRRRIIVMLICSNTIVTYFLRFYW